MRRAICLLILFPSLAFAHPGAHHGSLLAALEHLLSSPDHLAWLGLALGVGAAAALISKRRAK